jgi:hypothetical protein
MWGDGHLSISDRAPAMTSNEEKVLKALDDPKWDWRTLAGLERSTGLSQNDVLSALNDVADRIEVTNSEERGLLFRLKNRTASPAPALEKFLDFISLGKRSRGA